MGIKIEFNPDLALRDIEEFKTRNRKKEECVPDDLTAGTVYEFLKSGQRNYWLEGEIPLLKTKGQGRLSLPLASIIILEATHFNNNGENYTKGKYKVIEVFGDGRIHFNGFAKVN